MLFAFAKSRHLRHRNMGSAVTEQAIIFM